MSLSLRRATLVLIISLLITSAVLAQSPVLEQNVRAELTFLASDAMQGRGSGTVYERIAAEYVGSQFRQFGLEPGGDADGSGNKGFVQRVALESVKFVEAPTFTVTSGTNVQKWQYGRDFLVNRVRAPQIAGDLQIVEPSGTFTKGAIVAVKLPEGANQEQRQAAMMKAFTSGSAAIVILETEANKQTREIGEQRLPTLPPKIPGTANESFAIISLRKDAFDTLLSMPAGTKAEFGGRTEVTEANTTWNVIGILRGSDPAAANEVIVLSAHLDHMGVSETLTGDKIFNGADDDASGCVAVLELARALATGKRPRRTIYFVGFGSEERGGYGSRHFRDNPPVPLTQIVANLNFEMLGRPDPNVGADKLWLTGFERSNLGRELAKQGAPLVADPYPAQNFFQRSDNYNLALLGVIAQTVSSFGLHKDYHRVSDDITKIDFPFMTRAINSMVKPIQWLANSTFRPEWVPGQAPTRN